MIVDWIKITIARKSLFQGPAERILRVGVGGGWGGRRGGLLLGICFWREGIEAAFGPEQRG
jgi:hypothetical protein